MFCTNCGKEVTEGASFCSNCGAKVLVPVKPAYEVAPVAVEEPKAEAPKTETPAYEVAPIVDIPVEETPVVPAYEVAPLAVEEPKVEEPVYIPEPVAQPVEQPVYVPDYQQTDDVKNNGRVSFGKAIALLFTNIVNFTGKASRSEFWFGYLFTGLVVLGAMIINYGLGIFSSFAVALPTISLSVRRIRDTGKNWNYIFMGFIPIVGVILLIINFCKDTDSEKE